MSRPMTHPESRVRHLLAGYFRGQERLLEELLAEGLIDLRTAERQAIRGEVEQLARDGMGRCEAMEVVAQRFCCSYEKVRAAVYQKK